MIGYISMLIGTQIDTICNICMALGGIGTLGTLIYMIVDSKRKAKQINAVQRIQSHQLESLYEPALRLVSWSFRNVDNNPNELVVNNRGEDLCILDIHNVSGLCVANNQGMSGWFPYNLDKGETIHIPLLVINETIKNHTIEIVCSNKLGLTYLVSIHIVEDHPRIEKPALL